MKIENHCAALLLAVATIVPAGNVAASPFTSCPAQAFLVQGKTAVLYGVDLSTGYVEKLANNIGTSDKFNGVGFNLEDRYIYGWSYEHKTVARLTADYTLEPLPLTTSINDNFYVGDVSVSGSQYYFYKRGSGGSHGLWRVDLDPASDNYLTPKRIVDGRTLSLQIFDMAFHPDNGKLYSVTSAGDLVVINPNSGAVEFLARLSERGTFGAVYFDVDGNLYASRNTDGQVFRISVDSSAPTLEPYAQGPNSSQNDGARCALAPVTPLPSTKLDFGDAPDSYGTSFAKNGPRHQLEEGGVILGTRIDSEVQPPSAPESDDSVGSDDEDGVSFITDLAAGETALISIKATGAGYVNAWIDYNDNGSFDTSEKILDGRYINNGSQIISFDVPADISTGDTWARFRISSSPSLPAVGGAADGEVEDYEVSLFGRRVTTSYYPAANSSVTLAYEDLWPRQGDYDMNDLVLSYRTELNAVSLDNDPGSRSIDSIVISGEVEAIGASIKSGFAVEIPGLPRAAVDQANMSLKVGGEYQPDSFLEVGAGSENAVFIIYENVFRHVTKGEGCKFYRTEDFCGGTSASRFKLTIPVTGEVSADIADDLLFNPFIFGVNARRTEVHLMGRPPTIKAEASALGSYDDASNPSAGKYYQTSSGLPWAIVIGGPWAHTEEGHDIVQTYPSFEAYVSNGGGQSSDWFRAENAIAEKLFQE
ncbi:LruC domain-containing protein [Halioglobus maricola]|uniref:LruC domain-containing protein n=1 Tax=Halioglobus maricola TaxID=2601894 RepID=A0A5P9NFN1_9GAMM|nr:LruC domain-containing protein [Halioglobus maricola]QFU74582.1 LruC domain-containing protein [Halioglobus maricola]